MIKFPNLLNDLKKDILPGGKGDKAKPSDFSPEQIKMGLKVEMEHTNDPHKALEITLDHLSENNLYYSRLKGAGLADELEKAGPTMLGVSNGKEDISVKHPKYPNTLIYKHTPKKRANIQNTLNAHKEYFLNKFSGKDKESLSLAINKIEKHPRTDWVPTKDMDSLKHEPRLRHAMYLASNSPSSQLSKIADGEFLWRQERHPDDSATGDVTYWKITHGNTSDVTKEHQKTHENRGLRKSSQVYNDLADKNNYWRSHGYYILSSNGSTNSRDPEKKSGGSGEGSVRSGAKNGNGLRGEYSGDARGRRTLEKTDGTKLTKGVAKRLFPYNPNNTSMEERIPVERWTSGYFDRARREDIPRMEGHLRDRAIHNLHKLAPNIRRNPETGEREFLLFRGKTLADVNIGMEGLSSFTTDYNKAKAFNLDLVNNLKNDAPENHIPDDDATLDHHIKNLNRLKGQDKDDYVREHFGHIYHAWVPESAIHYIPKAIGSKAEDYNVDPSLETRPGPAHRAKENEVIINTRKVPKISIVNSEHDIHNLPEEVGVPKTNARTEKIKDLSLDIKQKQMYDPLKQLKKGLHGDWKKEGYKIGHEAKMDGHVYVYARHPNDPLTAGMVMFHPDDMIPLRTNVREEHQRKGLATAMYQYAEKLTGKKMNRGTTQSDEALGLWQGRSENGEKLFGKSMTAEQESEIIKENKKKPEASKRHKFKSAVWTHPNGHPRCKICGNEEKIGGYCDPLTKSAEVKHIASVAVISGNSILMGKRQDSGKYTHPGGHLEQGEGHEDGALRELFEEAGIEPESIHKIGSGPVNRNGKKLMIHCFAVFGKHKTTTKHDPDEEVGKWEWIDTSKGLPDHVAHNLHSPNNILLQKLGLQDENN